MKKYGINFTLVLVDYVPNSIYNTIYNADKIRITKEELGCCLSHLWCLNNVIINKCKNAIIFEDDIILDCFGGSGSTSIASLNLNRYSISIELEKEWYEVIKMRLENYKVVPLKVNGSKSSLMKATKQTNTKHQVSLFG